MFLFSGILFLMLLGVKPGASEDDALPAIDDEAEEGEEILETVPEDHLESESRGPD